MRKREKVQGGGGEKEENTNNKKQMPDHLAAVRKIERGSCGSGLQKRKIMT